MYPLSHSRMTGAITTQKISWWLKHQKGRENMPKHIRNMNDLAKALQPTLLQLEDILADRVYETLNYYLNPWSSFAGLNCKKQYLRRIPAFWKPNFYHPMGEEIWGFRIAEILVKCEIKGIFIGLNFTDSGNIIIYRKNSPKCYYLRNHLFCLLSND